uniref:T-box domain-containing protein n=2 Tax=Lutzomyia longipalpis TaxID=7200 RepID=A0A1B0CH35_LUTLO
MLLGTQNHCGANLANSKGATDFSIAAIMARGPSSREPSERSISPISVDRFPEGDDDVDVDVEQCSDSEGPPRTPRTSSTALPTPPSPSDEDRLSPEPVQTRPGLLGSCNCDELRPVQCHLETKELWDKFHELGTEMIITKTGR